MLSAERLNEILVWVTDPEDIYFSHMHKNNSILMTAFHFLISQSINKYIKVNFLGSCT